MKYLILLLALNASATINDNICDENFCYGPEYSASNLDGDECDQDALDEHSAEIGAYEITCEELEEL